MIKIKTCPPGKVINPKTGRCVIDRSLKKPRTCPPGKVINPKTDRCVKKKIKFIVKSKTQSKLESIYNKKKAEELNYNREYFKSLKGKRMVINELTEKGQEYIKIRKDFGKDDPLRKSKSKSKSKSNNKPIPPTYEDIVKPVKMVYNHKLKKWLKKLNLCQKT